MVYGYTRETPGGEQLRNAFSEQKMLLKKEAVDCLVTDTKPKGKKKSKYAALSKLLVKLQPGDVLVIPSIDRVSASASEFAQIMSGLINRGVAIRVLNLGTLDNTRNGLLLQKAVMAFAQFEKAMVTERTQAHKAEMRMDLTFREGRPKKYSATQISAALKMLENSSYNRVSKITGISISTLTRAHRAQQARRHGEYVMTEAEIREYEAMVANSRQMSMEDFL